MKNEILIVPDIHGRKFWEEPCNKWNGKIIFLGDYHDPYLTQVNITDSLKNLENLVNFYKNNKDRIICLLGNHDGNYLIHKRFADRLDIINYDKVKGLLNELNLKIAYKFNNILFSHSGVLPKWLEINKLKLDDIYNLSLNSPALEDISPMRGGSSEVGGILWGDVLEYALNKHIPNIYQVFGHTQMDNAIIESDFACLDCRKCFILDTNKIIPWT